MAMSGFRITPVLAVVQPGYDLVPNPEEVDAVFEVPLSFLMNPENHGRGRADLAGRRAAFLPHALWRPEYLGHYRRHRPHVV